MSAATSQLAREREPLRPGRNDVAKWRRLVREARAAADQPDRRPSGDLAEAVRLTRDATAPGMAALQSCAALRRLAEAFPTSPLHERQAMVRPIRRHADQVEAALLAFAKGRAKA